MDAITASERALSGGDKVRDEIEHWVCEGEEQVVADTRKQGNSEESGRSDEGRRGCGERAGGDSAVAGFCRLLLPRYITYRECSLFHAHPNGI